MKRRRRRWGAEVPFVAVLGFAPAPVGGQLWSGKIPRRCVRATRILASIFGKSSISLRAERGQQRDRQLNNTVKPTPSAVCECKSPVQYYRAVQSNGTVNLSRRTRQVLPSDVQEKAEGSGSGGRRGLDEDQQALADLQMKARREHRCEKKRPGDNMSPT